MGGGSNEAKRKERVKIWSGLGLVTCRFRSISPLLGTYLILSGGAPFLVHPGVEASASWRWRVRISMVGGESQWLPSGSVGIGAGLERRDLGEQLGAQIGLGRGVVLGGGMRCGGILLWKTGGEGTE